MEIQVKSDVNMEDNNLEAQALKCETVDATDRIFTNILTGGALNMDYHTIDFGDANIVGTGGTGWPQGGGDGFPLVGGVY